jgi:dTDP-4-dehydrorhamnose reductase
MKIMVVGRGWTGGKVASELKSRGHTVELVSHRKAPNLDRSFNWVVNCAGVTGSPNVDACETDKFNTIEGNVVFPISLQKIAYSNGVKFAHFSSGCIYSGEIEDVWQDPNFFGSTYSISKGISDLYLKHLGLVFRIRMPFTGMNEPKNYLTKVLKYAKSGKLIDSGQNSLTDHDEAVKVACDLIENNAIGPFNLVNEGSINMHELVELFGITPEWYTQEEFENATACKRSTCVIPSSGLMRPIRDALKDAISSLEKDK